MRVNSTTNHADLQVLLDSSEEYMIGKDQAVYIIEEVKAGVKHWKSIATRLGIAKREMDVFEQVFQRSLKYKKYVAYVARLIHNDLHAITRINQCYKNVAVCILHVAKRHIIMNSNISSKI